MMKVVQYDTLVDTHDGFSTSLLFIFAELPPQKISN